MLWWMLIYSRIYGHLRGIGGIRNGYIRKNVRRIDEIKNEYIRRNLLVALMNENNGGFPFDMVLVNINEQNIRKKYP